VSAILNPYLLNENILYENKMFHIKELAKTVCGYATYLSDSKVVVK
jgi:hypothetical protein